MDTLNKIFQWEQKKVIEHQLPVTNEIENMNYKLMAVFWMNEDITVKNKSWNTEVNQTELKLAKIFGKEKEMRKLQPISLASVMQDLENFKMAA